jgi:hypothetical protein
MSQASPIRQSETPRSTVVFVLLLLLFVVDLGGFWLLWSNLSELSRRVEALENYQRAREAQPQMSDLFYQKVEIDNFNKSMDEWKESAGSVISTLQERLKAAEKKLDEVREKLKP